MARSDRSLSYGNMAHDGSHTAEVGYANTTQMFDASVPALVSPLISLSITVPVELNIPNNSPALTVCSTTAVRVYTTSNFTTGGYFVVPAGVPQPFDCAGTNQVFYIMSDATAGNVSFSFAAI